MSVSDEVDMLYGRRIQPVPEQVRWIESFTVRACACALHSAELQPCTSSGRPRPAPAGSCLQDARL
jgi:hypothetical protein